MIDKKDMETLRELGSRYMEIASLPVQKEKINLWKALNRNKMERPMVVIDQLPWNELNIDGQLESTVSDPFWRSIETGMRMELLKWNYFPVDMVLDDFIKIPKAIHSTGYGLSTQEEILKTDESNSVVSHQFINQIVEENDVDKIKDMVITHNEAETKKRHEEALEIFKGIGPVKMTGFQFHLGIWDFVSMIMGVENIYFDLIDRPEMIHRLMENLTNSVIAGIDQCNRMALHDDMANTCHCSYIYTDELLPDSGQGKGPYSENTWAFGLAQLFSSCSPDITKEFEVPYINRMAEHFGAIYYGCCDRLDDRLELIKSIPNVRKISCSPWSKKAEFSEAIGSDYIISNKPNPAFVATASLDESVIKKDLEETCRLAKQNNGNLEIILKDISTVQYEPERLVRWHEIAMDVVNNY